MAWTFGPFLSTFEGLSGCKRRQVGDCDSLMGPWISIEALPTENGLSAVRLNLKFNIQRMPKHMHDGCQIRRRVRFYPILSPPQCVPPLRPTPRVPTGV